jgi:hypothetical protein
MTKRARRTTRNPLDAAYYDGTEPLFEKPSAFSKSNKPVADPRQPTDPTPETVSARTTLCKP